MCIYIQVGNKCLHIISAVCMIIPELSRVSNYRESGCAEITVLGKISNIVVQIVLLPNYIILMPFEISRMLEHYNISYLHWQNILILFLVFLTSHNSVTVCVGSNPVCKQLRLWY